MTLTQIYSQYVTVSEQLLLRDEENKKLNNYIDQILQVTSITLDNSSVCTIFFVGNRRQGSHYRKAARRLREIR